jgi:hypothetical protein
VLELKINARKVTSELESARLENNSLRETLEKQQGILNVVTEKNARIAYLEKREASTWHALLAKAQIQVPYQSDTM